MSTGDVPIWIAAIATCVGVVVNGAVVVAALLPLHRAAKQRKARGLLTAAYLRIPLGIVYTQMGLACSDLVEYVRDAPQDRAELGASVARLRALPARARSLLAKFNIVDAAYLPDDNGQQLAQTIGEVESVLSWLEASIGKFDTVKRAFEARIGLPGSASSSLLQMYLTSQREVTAHAAEFLPEFQSATDHLGEFAKYCDRLFPHDA